MTRGAPRTDPADGLQPERTSLAWSRTSVGALGTAVLLLIRELHGDYGPHQLVPAGMAVLIGALTYAVGLRRQRLLRCRPLPRRITARGEVWTIGVSITVLIVVTALMLPLGH